MKDYFTSLVRCKDAEGIQVVPVKSTEAVEMELFLPMSRVLSRVYVGKPVRRGDIICTNVLNMGIDIIATRTIE